MTKFIVYALTDPRDGAVRYVGLSNRGEEDRGIDAVGPVVRPRR